MIVLEEDALLHVYESPEAIALAIEGLDAEDTLRQVFDDTGQQYRIDWIRPNRESRSFLGFRAVSNGQYRLTPSGSPNPAALLQLLHDSPVPEKDAITIAKVEARLRAALHER